jgi:hypothetical protein
LTSLQLLQTVISDSFRTVFLGLSLARLVGHATERRVLFT